MNDASTTTESLSFSDYVEHGWKLVPIARGTKGPRTRGWNLEENCIDDPDDADRLAGAGLAHAYSGTCCIDVDVYDLAQEWLGKKGIDLDALRLADDAVQIISGQSNRGKLLYRLPPHIDPLPSLKLAEGAFELRCATRNGRTVQDVLPPSVHPNGKRYKWVGNWTKIPELPGALLELWQQQVAPNTPNTPKERQRVGDDELERLLKSIHPDCDYEDWVKVGMALHHEYGDAGFDYWDNWSAGGSKYKGSADLQFHWDSFGQGGDGGRPVTLGSLRRQEVASIDEFDDLDDVELDDFSEVWEKREDENPFKFELLQRVINQPPARWVVKGVIPQGEIVMLYGPSGAGKSFVALDLGLAIARGVPWRGHTVTPGNVAWIAAEAAGSIRNRGRAYIAEHDCHLDDLPYSFHVLGAGIDLGNLKEMRQLADAAREVSPAFIVVDTLAAASGGANENSGEDMNKVMQGCRLLHQESGATILLVHHSGKDKSKGARGWSGIKAAVDAELEVTRDGERRAVVITKLRDGEEGAAMAFNLKVVVVGEDEDGEAVTSCVIDHLPDFEEVDVDGNWHPTGKWQKRVWALLTENPKGLTLDQLATGVGDVVREKEPDTENHRINSETKRACTNLLKGTHIEFDDGVWRIPSVDLSIPDDVADLF